jgi:hypothetical protein
LPSLLGLPGRKGQLGRKDLRDLPERTDFQAGLDHKVLRDHRGHRELPDW